MPEIPDVYAFQPVFEIEQVLEDVFHVFDSLETLALHELADRVMEIRSLHQQEIPEFLLGHGLGPTFV